MRIAIVGATGLVGSVMLKVLHERNIAISELILVASENSKGKKLSVNGAEYTLHDNAEALLMRPDIALFSAGSAVSLEWAPKYAAIGCKVIDNSSAWRMNPKVKLIIPEINASILGKEDKIIANPNCSTIQMLMVLNPLHKKYGIKRIVVSTYQSVSGTGVKAIEQLMNERNGISGVSTYPHQIDLNALPQIDSFLDNGYTKEEMKMYYETRKIMDDESIALTATTVRIPVKGGHSESVNIEFLNEYDLNELRTILEKTAGVIVEDDIAMSKYPMPLFAEGKDDVFVGRLRRDESQAKTLNCWIVADNLRKGAATNAVQIASYLIEQNLI